LTQIRGWGMDKNKKRLSDGDYLNHLKQQHDFLKADITQYESGRSHFANKIAVTLRTLFHNTPASKSIFTGLSIDKKIEYYFRDGIHQFDVEDDSVTFYTGFALIHKPDFEAPFYDNFPFDTYWNRIVYKEGKVTYIRKQIILYAANKFGGAHVDPEIPAKYVHIVEGKGITLKSKEYGEETIISRVVYEMALQVDFILSHIIPQLENQ